MQYQTEILIPIVLFVVTGMVFIALFYYRYRTRSVFAEKGYTADEIIKIFNLKKIKDENPKKNLKIGIFFLISGIGFVIGNYLQDTVGIDYAFAALMILSTGLAFLVIYFINKKAN